MKRGIKAAGMDEIPNPRLMLEEMFVSKIK